MIRFRFTLYLVVLILFFAGCRNDKNELPKPINPCIPDSASISWNNSIHSLIQNQCSTGGCHVSEADGGNGIDYSDYSAVKDRINSGIFQQRVFVTGDMPADRSVISDCDLLRLKIWITNGAPQ